MGIEIDVQARTSKAEQDLAAINRSLKNIEVTTNKTSESFKNMFRNFGSIAAAGVSVAYLKNISTEFTNLSNQIALVTGRTKDLVETQEALYDIAERTRGSIKGSVGTFASFGKALKTAGVSTEKLLQATETVQKAIAISGSSSESANAALIQLGQGLSSGTLRGEELNSVLEQTPRIGQAIADELKVTTGQLRLLAADGKVTSSVVFGALLKQSEQINKEFSTIKPTLTQASGLLSDSFKIYVSELDKGLGLSEASGLATFNLAKNIKEASKNAFDLGTRISFAFNKISSNITGILGPLKDIVLEIGKQFLQVLPEGFLTRTLSGDINKAIRAVDKFSGGLISSFNRFSVFDLISIDSDVEKAIKKLKRLSPKYWAGAGFDIPTLKAFFSRENIIAYSAGFKDLAVAIANNTDSIGVRINNFFKSVDFGFKAISRYFGFRMDTLITFKGGQWEAFLTTISEVIRGLSNTSLKVYEFAKVIKNTLYPASYVFTQAIKDSLSTIPGQLLAVTESAFKVIIGFVSISYQIISDLVNDFDIYDVFQNAYEGVVKLFDGVRSKANLDDVVDNIKDFGKKVIRVFFEIYDAVIGHSWWTDTVGSVIETSENLWDKASKGLNRFKTNTVNIFKNIFDKSNKMSFDFSDIKSIDFSFDTFKMPVLKTDGIVEAFADAVEAVKPFFVSLFETFPSMAKLALASIGAVLVSLLFPASIIKNVLVGVLLTSIASSSTLIAEEFGRSLTGGSLVATLGHALGQAAGIVVATMIRELPEFLNALLGTVSSFIRGFVGELPAIGTALKAIFGIADAIGVSGPLGLIAGVLFGKGALSLLKDLKLVEGGFDGIFGKFANISTVIFGDAAGKREGIISQYFFGALGPTRGLAIIGLLMEQMGVFNSLFANSALAEYATQGGLLYLTLTGGKGLSKVSDLVGSKVIAPLSEAIQNIGKTLSKDTSLYNVFFGDTGTWSERASTAIKAVLDKVTGKVVDWVAPAVSSGFDFIKTVLLGKNPEKTIAFAQLFIANIMDDMAVTVGRLRSKVGDRISEIFSSFKMKSTSAGSVTIDTSKLSEMASKAAAAMSSIGGEHGLLGKLYFGKYGKAALVATILALFTTVSMAGESINVGKSTSVFDDMVSNWNSLKVENPFAAIALQISAVTLPLILGALFYFKRQAIGALASVFSLNNVKAWTSGVASAIGNLGRGMKGIIGAGLGAGIGYAVAESLSPGFGMAGAELGLALGFALRTAILGALKWVAGAILAVFTSWITAAVLAVTAVTGLLYLAIFGEENTMMEELNAVYKKTKEIIGLGDKPKSKTLGLNENTASFASSRSLGLSYDVSQINPKLLSTAEKDKLASRLEELDKTIETARLEEEKTGKISNDTRDSIRALNRGLEKYADKLSLKKSPAVKDFGKFLEDLKNNNPRSFAAKTATGARQTTLDIGFKINEWLLEARRMLASTPAGKLGATNAIEALQAERSTKYNARYRGEQAGEDRLRELEKNSKNLEFTNDALKADIENLVGSYALVAQKIADREAGIFTNTIIPASDPMMQDKMRLESELAAKMDLQIWYRDQQKAIEKFKADLSELDSSLKMVGITFESNELFAANQSSFETLQEIGKEIKDLAKELENASNIAEKNAIIVRIEERRRQVVDIKEAAQTVSLDRKQYKLREKLEGLGVGILTDATLQRLSDEAADNLYELAIKQQTAANALKFKKPADMSKLSPDDKIKTALAFQKTKGQLTQAQVDEIKKTPEAFLPKAEDYRKALAENEVNRAFFVKQILAATDKDADTILAKTKDLASVVGVDFTEAVRTRGLDKTTKDVNRLVTLQNEINRTDISPKDLRQATRDFKTIKDSLTEALPTLNTMLSDINSLGVQLSLEDLGSMKPQQLKGLQEAAATMRGINKQLEELSPNASKSTIDSILKRKADASKKAFEASFEVLYSTPEKVQQAFSRMGITDFFDMSALSTQSAEAFLKIDSQIQFLQNQLKSEKNVERFKDIVSQLAEANREATRLKSNLNFKTQLETLNKATGLNLSEGEFARLPKMLRDSLSKGSDDLKTALENAQIETPGLINNSSGTPSGNNYSDSGLNVLIALDRLRSSILGAAIDVQNSGAVLDDQISKLKTDKISQLSTKIVESLPGLSDFKDSIEKLGRQDLVIVTETALKMADAKRSFDLGLLTSTELQSKMADAMAKVTSLLNNQGGVLPFGTGTRAKVKEAGLDIPQEQMNLMSEAGRARVDALAQKVIDASKDANGATSEKERIAAQNMVNAMRDSLEEAIAKEADDKRKRVSEAGKAFASSLSDTLVSSIADAFKGVTDGDKSVFVTLRDRLASALSNTIIDTFTKGLMDPLTGENGVLTQVFKNLGSKIFSAASGSMSPAGGATTAVATTAATTGGTTEGGGILSGIWSTITAGFASLLSFFGIQTSQEIVRVTQEQATMAYYGTLLIAIPEAIAASTISINAAIQAAAASIALSDAATPFATGGYVSGPGTSTSDSISAMLSNGEFVVNAKATKNNFKLLSAINSGSLPKFADGGFVSSMISTPKVTTVSSAGSAAMDKPKQQVFQINITGDVSRQTRSEIQRMIPNIAYGVNSYNRERG